MTLASRVERLWYGNSAWRWLLWPLSLLFLAVVTVRRWRWLDASRRGWRAPVPVIVVGNLTVGGTGKTPLVLAIIELARALGLRPGVVSRGYGGQAAVYPCAVEDHPDAGVVGDEPLLLWRRGRCPVVVAPRRAAAAAALWQRYAPDLIISDDGLQHYALVRDAEIVIVDAARRFGNGLCLPAGPLREPLSRLRSVDLVVGNGGVVAPGSMAFHLVPTDFVSLADGSRRRATCWAGVTCVAVAGIGNPERFFATLRELGLAIEPCPFPDHYRFAASDFARFAGRPLLMTEKDAVKCRALGLQDAWYLEVEARLEPALRDALTALLTDRRSVRGQEVAGHPGLPGV